MPPIRPDEDDLMHEAASVDAVGSPALVWSHTSLLRAWSFASCRVSLPGTRASSRTSTGMTAMETAACSWYLMANGPCVGLEGSCALARSTPACCLHGGD